MCVNTITSRGNCVGFERLDFSDSSAVGLASIPVTANRLLFRVEKDTLDPNSNNIARLSETSLQIPTPAVGIPVDDGMFYEIDGQQNINQFRIISVGAFTQTIWVQYYQ